jgi:UDP-GlcNAc:undecaprenyl-phosphate/decaprenyl-phosphate GlcNAc-1-phosphate transferase
MQATATQPVAEGWSYWLQQVDHVLSPYMGVFFIAFLVSFALTPLMRRLAVRNGIVDWPDLKRKSHVEPVAYLGGLAIFLGWASGIFLSLFTQTHNSGFGAHVDFPPLVLAGAAVIVVVGLVDDIAGISPRAKVGGQLIAAAALASLKADGQMLGAKLVVSTLATVGVELPAVPVNILGMHIDNLPAYALGTAIVAAFVLGGCNSLNLLDGLDGLAAGVATICALGFLGISVYVAVMDSGSRSEVVGNQLYDSVRVVMCLAMMGGLLGFLPYNFNPANIFMGDAGSLLVGYMCVSTILLFTHTTVLGPFLVLAGLIVFAVPITDTTLAIVRRKLRGQPIFSPDREHLHHMLLRAAQNLHLGPNASVKAAVLAMYAMSAAFACLGFGVVLLRMRYVMAVFIVVFGFIVVMAYKRGHQQVLKEQSSKSVAASGGGATGSPVTRTSPETAVPSR